MESNNKKVRRRSFTQLNSEITDDNETKPIGSSSTVFNKIEYVIRMLCVPLRTLFCLSNILAFIPAYFGFMFTVLWTKKLWPRFYWIYEGTLYKWLLGFVAYWGYSAGYYIYEFGDDIRSHGENDRVLVICNHQSTADVPTLFAVFHQKGVISQKAVWLMSTKFKWSPFGLVSAMHGDYFIQAGRSTRDDQLNQLETHLEEIFWERDRRWVVVFPEGGFYHKKVEGSREYARKNKFPHLERVTLPRMGAVKTILKTVGLKKSKHKIDKREHKCCSEINFKSFKDRLDVIRKNKHLTDARPPIKWILDVTIAYPDEKPLKIENLMIGNRETCTIAVNYRMFPVEEVPFDDDTKLRDWMYRIYEEKDQLLEHYYKHGTFNEDEQGKQVKFSWSTMIGQCIFWFMSFAIQMKFCCYLLSSFYQFIFSFVY